MIRLYKLIRELEKLIDARSELREIAFKTGAIISACQILIREHGNQSDIAQILEDITMIANRMGRVARGAWGSSPFDYEIAVQDVNSMKDFITQIGKILRIEFKETQS